MSFCYRRCRSQSAHPANRVQCADTEAWPLRIQVHNFGFNAKPTYWHTVQSLKKETVLYHRKKSYVLLAQSVFAYCVSITFCCVFSTKVRDFIFQITMFNLKYRKHIFEHLEGNKFESQDTYFLITGMYVQRIAFGKTTPLAYCTSMALQTVFNVKVFKARFC